jgi:molybdenum cofactor cytidylyltransferase
MDARPIVVDDFGGLFMTSFAILPAAGRSRRMGNDKLLLPWGDATVIDAVLTAWKSSQVDHVVIVVHPDDTRLAERCGDYGVDLVVATRPPEQMKDSVRLGLEFVQRTFHPQDSDVWLLSPADTPTLTAEIINRVLAESATACPITVPTTAGRRGHPVAFRWSLAGDVGRLGRDEGVRAIVARYSVNEIPLEDERILDDLDTPADYDRLRPL